MSTPLRVAVLDDHPNIIDGVRYRLEDSPQFEIVATASHGSDLAPMLERDKPDLLLLDIGVPTSADDATHFPILDLLPALIEKHARTRVVILTMHNQRALVRRTLQAGACGFILKDDLQAVEQLGQVLSMIVSGEQYISENADFPRGERLPSTYPLTLRQHEVLSYLAANPNHTTLDAAKALKISHSTVRNHLSAIYERLEVRNLPAAIEKARQLGLLTPNPPPPPEPEN